ncbi:MAG: hypothetical protein JNK04_19115, partial [Myxococcales bacterium]|nr:hypothetical protein [Myxococcales bacterium]
ASERTLELSLPPLEGDAVLLRVPRPFGPAADLELLNVEVKKGDEASSCCRLMRESPALASRDAGSAPRTDAMRWLWLVALIAVLILAAVMARS